MPDSLLSLQTGVLDQATVLLFSGWQHTRAPPVHFRLDWADRSLDGSPVEVPVLDESLQHAALVSSTRTAEFNR